MGEYENGKATIAGIGESWSGLKVRRDGDIPGTYLLWPSVDARQLPRQLPNADEVRDPPDSVNFRHVDIRA